jgi:hypothetical protein
LNGRVCFLARSGDTLSSVRLVGPRSDDIWRAGASDEGVDARADSRAAAAWIAERAPSGVSLLCIDVDGSNCSWLTLAGTDAMMVAASLDRHEDVGADWRSPESGEASIQALTLKAPPTRANPGDAVGVRAAVLAVPDALARLVIDELDDRGVGVENAASLWHALALAWDPASPLLSGPGSGSNIVGSEAPPTAVVLIEPSGRIVWAWSRAGDLLAGGVVMTPAAGDSARIGKGMVSRVVADWLGWSVQLGVMPVRIVCVSAPTGTESTDEDLAPAQIGAALGRGWSGATVDMAVVDDPIGATLERLAGLEREPPESTTLRGLTGRPRRVHRAMFLWASLAVVLLAAGLTGIGVKAWTNAGEARTASKGVREATREAVLKAAPPPANDAVAQAIAEGNPRQYLEDRINEKLKEKTVPSGLPPVRPILSELDSLSLVLMNDDIELEEIHLSDSIIHVYVYVPATRVAEEIKESLENIANDHCVWTLSYPATKKNNLQLVWLEGSWKSKAGSAAGGTP